MRDVNRRDFLSLLLGPPALPSQAGRAGRRPNIVLIILDDLGYGDLGCYGQRHIQTPNTDRIAAEGMRFTDCYAGGSVCAPSRSVLMTGLHTGHTAVRANAGTVPLLPEDLTLAEVLKDAGYATGGFGKWGLGDAGTTGVPTRQGFDEFFGYLHQVHAHSYYPEFLWHNEQKHPLAGNLGGGRGQYSADLIAERSFEFIRKHREKPFFLYACYTLPHARFEIPSLEPYETKPWTQGQKTYAAMITKADRHVGTIMRLLKELGSEHDTVVFLTSDNGAHEGEQKGFRFFRSNGPLRGQKGQLYEGGIRVPMIVRWPGKIKPGSVSSHPWAFLDFLPTTAELADAKAPPGIDGVSLLPTLLGKRQLPHEFFYWEHHQFDAKARRLRPERLVQAVRMANWKALRRGLAGPLELYNLTNDPGETTDVSSSNPGVVARIEAYLKTARTKPRPHDNGSMEWAR